jgi:hypothetical protein
VQKRQFHGGISSLQMSQAFTPDKENKKPANQEADLPAWGFSGAS